MRGHSSSAQHTKHTQQPSFSCAITAALLFPFYPCYSVCHVSIQEFSAAIAAITAALLGPSAYSSVSGGSSSANSSLSGSGVRPPASGRKPVLPEGAAVWTRLAGSWACLCLRESTSHS